MKVDDTIAGGVPGGHCVWPLQHTRVMAIIAKCKIIMMREDKVSLSKSVTNPQCRQLEVYVNSSVL